MMTHLDLRSFNLADKNILTFPTNKAAKQHPLPYLCYITPAANRFWAFYVIVRKSQDGSFEVMRKDGNFFPITDRHLVGNATYIS